MRNRMILVLVAIVVIAALLACGTGGLISKAPTPTPTKTPRPTFTVTLTPTDTPVPTNTPTPTNTATPTPLPTNTPIVYTATPTPTSTDTPVPPTNTPKPTSRPKPQPSKTPTPRPQPTNTPKPQFQWTADVVWDVRYQANCGGVGIAKQSIIKDKSGAVINGARVQLDCYGNIFLSHASGTPGEYDPGHYDFWGLSTQPVNYTCTLQMYDLNGVRVSSTQVVTVSFDTGPCTPGGAGHQVAIVNWTRQY